MIDIISDWLSLGIWVYTCLGIAALIFIIFIVPVATKEEKAELERIKRQ